MDLLPWSRVTGQRREGKAPSVDIDPGAHPILGQKRRVIMSFPCGPPQPHKSGGRDVLPELIPHLEVRGGERDKGGNR